MPSYKLNIFVRVYKTRMSKGETIEQIDDSYPALSEEEKNQIHEKL